MHLCIKERIEGQKRDARETRRQREDKSERERASDPSFCGNEVSCIVFSQVKTTKGRPTKKCRKRGEKK